MKTLNGSIEVGTKIEKGKGKRIYLFTEGKRPIVIRPNKKGFNPVKVTIKEK